MKVKNAIERFEKFNKNAEVKLHGHGGYRVIGIMTGCEDETNVCIEDEAHYICKTGPMNVEQVLEHLKRFNPEATLRLHTLDGEEVLFIVAYGHDNNVVWLECESDNDMSSEISARFENAIEEGIDELDVYMEMLEIGIDVDMVRRWMGDEDADHMKEYCEEHGLI